MILDTVDLLSSTATCDGDDVATGGGFTVVGVVNALTSNLGAGGHKLGSNRSMDKDQVFPSQHP